MEISGEAKGPLRILEDLFFYKWMVICSYFGKGPPKISSDERGPFKILLFSIFLVSNVIWMSYRASLTSELSNRTHKKPFSNLEDLLQSEFQ